MGGAGTDGREPVRLTAAGHPAVTGRHDKTLELTAAAAITARATCVVGVSTGPLPGELPLLRGTVRLTLAAAGRTATIEGEVNPGYHSTGSLIVRRSDRLDPDTYLVNASAAAADLPAELLAALRVPGARVEVAAEETGTPTPVVLVLTGGPATDEIARLADQADLVVDLTGRGAPPPPVPLTAPRRHGLPATVDARTVLVLTEDPARAVPLTRGNRVVLWPPVPGADLLLSAGLPPTPLLHAGAATGPELTRLLAGTPAPVVVDLSGADPSEVAPDHTVLAAAPELGWGVRAVASAGAAAGPRVGGGAAVRVAPAAAGMRGRVAPVAAAAAAAAGMRGRVVLVPPPGDRVVIEPAELARLLRAAGSTGRDAAAALTALGVPRREAYRLAADPARPPR